MPIITHKTTGKVSRLSNEQEAKLRALGKLHAYNIESDTPPQIPKEIKKLSADKQKTAESDTHGTSTIIDGDTGGNAGEAE